MVRGLRDPDSVAPEQIMKEYGFTAPALHSHWESYVALRPELEAVGLWYDQLLSESLGKHELGATPLTTVNTRDLHSRHQQHQEGRRDKLITNLIVENWRREPVAIGPSPWNLDNLDDVAEKTYPQLMKAAREAVDRSLADDHRPTANIILPRKDEASLGQLFQMLMLATVVEGRLMGVNPYGQPGVEAYKRNMRGLLKKA